MIFKDLVNIFGSYLNYELVLTTESTQHSNDWLLQHLSLLFETQLVINEQIKHASNPSSQLNVFLLYAVLVLLLIPLTRKGVSMIRVYFGPISETVYIDIILNTIIER